MANVLAPFGFTPVRRLDGAAWTGNQSRYLIAAANTGKFYQGDVVTLLTTGYIDLVTPGSTVAAAGIFIGCNYLSSSQNRRVWSNQFPGGDTTTDVTAYIIDDPSCVFLAQSWTATTNKLTLDLLGANISFNTHANNSAVPAGNTLNGISGMVIDADTTSPTTTYTFRLVGIPGLTIGSLGAAENGYDTNTIYNVGLVGWNLQQFRLTAGI